ncbi:hypothetical protein JZ751_011323 [Albula glossodonta]|uniref:Pyrin domain-containing protein n=1 Tax=Albula glossodonta TaxID=121402 RepID=A0A8T2N128_9TELE|nr:hypothetical protein JZ751_011323 [Albula glossodonta]
MGKTVSDLIIQALENLSSNELDRFKRKLSELKEIGYGRTEKETIAGIAELIIGKFTKSKAIACTADVLRAIEQEDKAKDLEDKATITFRGVLDTTGASGGARGAANAVEMEDTRDSALSSTYEPDEDYFMEASSVGMDEPNPDLK